jgi:hypothetical protein
MKTLVPEEKKGLTVGDIVDAMHVSGEFAPLGREDIFAVVEMFIHEYVGIPGAFITKKFTPDEAKRMSVELSIPLDIIIKIVTIFRLKAGKQSEAKQKFMKLFTKVRAKGGGVKHGVTSRM